MTSTTTSPTAAPPGAAPRWRLGAAIAIAATGPVALGILRGILPYDTVDDPSAIVAKVAAHPGTEAAVLGLAYLGLLTLPIGVTLAARVAMRCRPVLGTVAAVVAWIGFVSLFAGIALDTIAFAGAKAATPAPTLVALNDALTAAPATAIPQFVFVPGHVLGVILLAIALWRAIPRWAAVALALSQPLHLVFAVFVPNHLLDALAWSLTGVGFAAAAVAGARMQRNTP